MDVYSNLAHTVELLKSPLSDCWAALHNERDIILWVGPDCEKLHIVAAGIETCFLAGGLSNAPAALAGTYRVYQTQDDAKKARDKRFDQYAAARYSNVTRGDLFYKTMKFQNMFISVVDNPCDTVFAVAKCDGLILHRLYNPWGPDHVVELGTDSLRLNICHGSTVWYMCTCRQAAVEQSKKIQRENL